MATDTPLQLGMVGLGRMGANIVRRLMRDGHACVGYDVNADAVAALVGEGRPARASLAELVAEARRAARGLGDGAGRRDHGERSSRRSPTRSSRATRSSTAATSYYRDDIRRARGARARRGSTTSTAAPAAASSGSSAATA